MNMSIIAASRLRGVKGVNTFIGNIATLAPDKSSMANILGISDALIKNYQTLNNDVRFFIGQNYAIQNNAFNRNESITYYLDLDGKVTSIGSNAFRSNTVNPAKLSLVVLPNSQTTNGAFSNRNPEDKLIISIPNSIPVGQTVLNDSVFSNFQLNGNYEVYTNIANQTNNSGNPDVDIQSLINKNIPVIYKQDNTPPPTAATINANTIGGTYVELNVSQPTHVNTLKYALVFVNGFFQDIIDINTTPFNVGGLNENSLNTVKIIIADEYFNISPYSNTINVTTATIDTAALFQNAVAYYKLDGTSGDAIDVVNGYNGTLFGGVTQGVAGKIGTAYSFDGVDGYIDIPDLYISTFTHFTARAWFKTTSSGQCAIFASSDFAGSGSAFMISVENGTIFHRFGGNMSFSGSFNDGIWHRIVVLYPVSKFSGDLRVFVDNQELSILQITDDIEVNLSTDSFKIGTRPEAFGFFFDGEIDEVCIDENYNLTLGEISDDYNNNSGTTI